MAKYSKKTSLNREQALELVSEFFESVGSIHGPAEIAKIFQDLVSRQELIMIARRLKIAQLLLRGDKYTDIQRKTKASMATIARISVWLNTSGEGFRLIYKKQMQANPEYKKSSWSSVKKRFPLYFWPQLLTESIMQNISKRDKKEIRKVLTLLDMKTRVRASVR